MEPKNCAKNVWTNGINCCYAHQQKRFDQRTRIPAIFRGPIICDATDLDVEANADLVDETAAMAKECRPFLERRRPVEQLRLFDVRRNGDPLLAVTAEQVKLINVNVR